MLEKGVDERKKDHRQKVLCRFGEGGRAERHAFRGVGRKSPLGDCY